MRGDPYAGPELSPPTTRLGRLVQRFVDWLQRRILAASTVGAGPYFDTALFPWVAELEAQWPGIRAELDALLPDRARLPSFHEIAPDVATITSDDHWKTFIFRGYGVSSARNLEACPVTARALAGVPALHTAFFSILEPGKRIPPHRGPYNGVLRLHLGLLVPQPAERCWIRVGGEQRHWREGGAMIFDDAYLHEVHNDTAGVRAVLFLDFERPCRAPWRWLNRLVLRMAMFTPLIREAHDRQQRWERLYYSR
ncbi:MAG TPA: aspartyl/asparaginyl beta-hydroxylase domain-containing protein [Xanthomonadaceae bacterium]|nr:aspartyl/asparaginyl beta-hydroxylase domain-containing protein [Xanthomonadaceae bacterium]